MARCGDSLVAAATNITTSADGARKARCGISGDCSSISRGWRRSGCTEGARLREGRQGRSARPGAAREARGAIEFDQCRTEPVAQGRRMMSRVEIAALVVSAVLVSGIVWAQPFASFGTCCAVAGRTIEHRTWSCRCST
jgi:hypothetical protein